LDIKASSIGYNDDKHGGAPPIVFPLAIANNGTRLIWIEESNIHCMSNNHSDLSH
jgi:hypothetical protein